MLETNQKNNLLVDELCQVLCRASLYSDKPEDCPYCIKGRCDKKMWSTFRKEAMAILTFINKRNIISKVNRLPGLGG